MEEKVTPKDILKHFFSSVFIYGILLVFICSCPIFYETIEHENFNYISFFLLYYLAYLIVAPIVFFTLKPKSILKSRNVAILGYFKRQFSKTKSIESLLEKIEPKENEKQAMMILFVKSFFGVSCVNMLCNTYLPSTMWATASQYIHEGSSITESLIQYVADTGDMWLKLIFTLSTLVFTISYLTDSKILKNEIKSVDTTPLGVLSCIICYYPLTLLTTKIIAQPLSTQIPTNNTLFFAILNILIVVVNFVSLIATVRLFGKAGNLTNRGIVTGFPYNIVRHPDYAMQICYIILCAILISFVPTLSIDEILALWIGVFVWGYIYYLRAVTEERHLIKDEEYQKYVEKVKFRFIPKIF
jgi:protein-S-isoprenylcysteine O-methyltransferase Ste14